MNTTTEIRHFATTADKGAMGMLTEDIRVTDCGPYGASCSIGVIPEGSEARQVFQGPMVPGPWGYAFTHASVIDATGHAHRELMAQTTIELGDLFTVEGLPGVYCFRNPVVRWLEGEGPQLQHVPSVEDPRA